GRAVHGNARPRTARQLRAVVRARDAALRAGARNGLPRPRDPPRVQRDREASAALASLTPGRGYMSVTQRRALKIGLEIAVPLAIFAAWRAYPVHLASSKFPPLPTILVEFRHMWLFSQFGTHVVPSLERIGLGLLLAVVVGIGLGIPIGLSRWARLWAMPH